MMHHNVVAILVVSLILAAVFARPSVQAVADAAMAADGEGTLAEGLRNTMDVVHTTADTVAPGRETEILPDSARIEQAGELRNNYSVFDHSNPISYPGYDDCDAVKHVFDDGWSAWYSVSFSLEGERDSERLLEDGRAFWESEGYTVSTMVTDAFPSHPYTRLWIETDDARIQFNVDTNRAEVVVRGITHCLNPQ